ncbi:excinuclease ABC subunit UvrA [Opitutus sp. ER46]|uniref:excinuclease ABC subunit UvrA n=1 Tax=Opitutus sp. ER46 TaxID=2161864 RepID=UPI001E595E14|nr:excinuclease ABC subunit UvrA [Opitutus sp. ER46]
MSFPAAPESIRLRGVRQNNLKGFDLDLPLGKYIVVTGLSGAGKSSLVFDTLHAEGQRRYVETFSAYTRQFLDLLDKPKVDSIENIRPSIAIEQTNTVKTSRSTVGTMTELTDFFKVWFSHVAECFDPATGEKVEDDNPQSIWTKVLAAHFGRTVVVGFRVTRPDALSWPEILKNLKAQSYVRVLLPSSAPAASTAASSPTRARRGKTASPTATAVSAVIASGAPTPSVSPAAQAAPTPVSTPAALTAHRIDDLLALPPATLASQLPGAVLYVAQDRVAVTADNRARFLEATETALHFGKGEVHIFGETDASASSPATLTPSVPATSVAGSASAPAPATASRASAWTELGHFSQGLHSPKTGRTFRRATPALFSFNSPLGACPKCRGFGRVIEIDYRLAIPDQSLSIDQGAIKCWEGEVYRASLDDLRQFTKRRKIPTDVPFASLTPEQQSFIIDGEPGYGEENGKQWPQYWYGVKGFFRWLEKTTYKMHVRVFLSRYRAYNPCPDCGGQRLQPESLCWKWQGRTLPELYTIPVSDLLQLLRSAAPSTSTSSAPSTTPPASSDLAYDAIVTRLRYLEQVGLSYLTLDRPSKTLSGGEVERVNLTSCLGTSLVDTLFVLDEPSVGLHARDIDRLIAIIRSLTDAGNTVVVVEHDEAMIRAADHVVEVGPEPGQRGGHITFQGTVADMLASPQSITGAYFSGRQSVPTPAARRPVATRPAAAAASFAPPWLTFRDATKHNLCQLTLRLPLQRLVCLSGVSGSGKSTLLDNVIYQGLLAQRHLLTEDAATIGSVTCDVPLGEVVLVDQSPLSRTPRSNPALYTEAWDLIRELYATTPAAQEAGFSASSFSFNSGDGRCEHCQGLGYERVEMQFLSDVFVPCPVCESRRFKPEILAIQWHGRSVADLLATSVSDALPLFAEHATIRSRLAVLDAVGMGYLTLGQPLNTLSGGESQRLKLVRYLSDFTGDAGPAARGALLLLDEPTTGLHRHDVKRLLSVLQALVDRGHSVVVIEHNLDVLKSADWLIEIGPEAGAGGGRIVAEGTPEDVAQVETATSPFLREALGIRSANATLLAAEAPGAYTTSRRGKAKPPTAAPIAPARPALAPVLRIEGARENNLKNLSLSIPHRQLNVVTGVSGSGKSTLAFDIVFAEGQRRFMESMSPYARQFVEQLPRPALDRLTGIPPTVAIEQRVTRGSRKSTVATITEVAQYLRLLYARLGVQHHPETDQPVRPLSPGELKQLLGRVLQSPAAKRAKHLYLCAPLIRGRKGHHQPIATWISRHGFELMRIDGLLTRVDAFQKLDRYREHDIEVVVSDLTTVAAAPAKRVPAARPAPRRGTNPPATSVAPAPATPAAALDQALALGKGACFLLTERGDILSWFSTTRTDIETGESFPELDPKNFSINSPRGWCPTCRGHGRVYPWMLELAKEDEKDDPAARLREFGVEAPEDLADEGQPCPECHGARLNRIGRSVKLHFRGAQPPRSLPELLRATPSELLARLATLDLDRRGKLIVQDIIPQIEERLKFLDHVGLPYLSLDRATETLSGGEAQRIRLAAQLGSNLSGVLYVLDEPSIGLHARDNDRLIDTLQALRAKGNTLLVVEHDDELMERADQIIDLGPAAGIHGGELLAHGTPEEIKRNAKSLTGLFLAKGIAHPLRGQYRLLEPTTRKDAWLELTGVRFRNLKGFDLRLPLGRLIMVGGPSGAGKSTLFRDVLHPAINAALGARKATLTGKDFVKATGFADDAPGATNPLPPFDALRGAQGFRRVVEVDQSPIGKTPRSTPATYLGIFDLIRQFFASLPESKIRGYTASRFSFNTPGGRCPTCEGAGRVKLEMAFMPDTYLPCDDCRGSRYSAELADLTWKGRNIGQVLELTFEEAATFFDFHSKLQQVCQLMVDCGLGYLTLGQSSPTLSGGEAQRLKLVTELSTGLASYRERSRGELPRNLYLLEEPTIGLHLSDCEKLIQVLHSLVDQGHTVVVIEHHLDLLAEADYVVELGPVGGPAGGELLYQGPLAGLLKVKRSPTAPYLRRRLTSAQAAR